MYTLKKTGFGKTQQHPLQNSTGKKKRGLGSALKLPPKGGWRKYEKNIQLHKMY